MDTALFNIFDLPMVLAIFLSLILASVLLVSAKDRCYRLLACYLYCMAVIEMDKVIFWCMPIHQLVEPAIPIFFAAGKCIGLMAFPLLYFYVDAVCNLEKPRAGFGIYFLIILISGATLSLLLYQSLVWSAWRRICEFRNISYLLCSIKSFRKTSLISLIITAWSMRKNFWRVPWVKGTRFSTFFINQVLTVNLRLIVVLKSTPVLHLQNTESDSKA